MSRLKQTKLQKTCKECNNVYSIDCFYFGKSAKDGHDPMCKKCRKLRAVHKKIKQDIARKEYIDSMIDNAKSKKLENELENNIDIKVKKYQKNIIPIQSLTNEYCNYCRINKSESTHHIIPRRYGGKDNDENLILLCNKCHDFIELKTEKWINSGKRYSIDIFKMMIFNLGFE